MAILGNLERIGIGSKLRKETEGYNGRSMQNNGWL